MADRIITQRLCDFCLADDVEHTDDITRYSLFGREVDACKTHGKSLEDLRAVVLDLGREVEPIVPTNERQPCPMCGKPLKNRGSVAAHVRQQHGTSLSELEGATATYACGVRGCDRVFTTPQGAAVHRTRAHDSRAA